MKLGVLILCTFCIHFVFSDPPGDVPDYDFNPELLFKAFRQNVTLPTRKPTKKPPTPPKNTTKPVIKPELLFKAFRQNVTLPTRKPTKKPPTPPKNTTKPVIKPVSAPEDVVVEGVSPVSVVSTPLLVVTAPAVVTAPPVTNNRCRCLHGQCACCTGSVLAAFNQKACVNMTYEPDDFAFTTMMIVNERVVYKNTFSGKNPPPICVRLPRIRAVKLCARFSNIYFSGPNMHTCIDLEADWEDISLFETHFDCIRFGAGGIGVLPPEEGGGANIVDESDEDIEDYDDSAR